jgi:hypothetical protein
MNATTVVAPVTIRDSWTRNAKVVFVALTIAVLLVLSFAVGRVTDSSAHGAPSITTGSTTSSGIDACHLGRPC